MQDSSITNIGMNDYTKLKYSREVKSDAVYYISDKDIDYKDTNYKDTIGVTEHNYDFDRIFHEMAERFNRVPTLEHKCHNCGGSLEINADKHIFICPYCNSVYAIGTVMING